MPSFIEELRRRNVIRVAAGYALVAWIFIEAGSVLLPEFGAPEWFFGKVYIPVVLGGFVVAMIFAWVFEITPEGVKLERDVDRETYQPRRKKGSSDRGRSRASIRLKYIAIDPKGMPGKLLQIDHCAKRTTDQTLDLNRTPIQLASRRIPLLAIVGAVREHRVFRSQPAT